MAEKNLTHPVTIKAIETRYAGCRFRSRLEARWAVFFDALGISWEYEPQGYDLGDAGPYLPDFFLRIPGEKCPKMGENCGYFVEIKPVRPHYCDPDGAIQKVVALATTTGHTTWLLAGTPGNQEHFMAHHHGDCVWARDRWILSDPSEMRFGSKWDSNFDFGWRLIRLGLEDRATFDAAVEKARSARFEHGEHP